MESSMAATEIMKIIRQLCDMSGYGIRSGINIGKKGHDAAEFIRGKLQNAGLDNVRLEPIQVNNPFPERYELITWENGEEKDLSETCYPIQWTVGTPPQGVESELIYVGDGSISQFEKVSVSGKIVLIDEKFIRGWIPSAKEGAELASKKGALAVLRANMHVESPQQQKYEGTPEELFPLPCFCLSKSCGDFLRNLALSSENNRVKVVINAPHDKRKGYNVVCELPGNGSMDETILVGTHYDTGHFTGAVDNNGSVGLMIKLAEYFALKPQSKRNRHIIFAWCSGHDFDLNSGHYQFAESNKKILEKAIVWDVDHAVGGIRYQYDEDAGKIVPVEGETCEFYVMSNNYVFSRLAMFTMDRCGFLCTQNRFYSSAFGPQWGMAPETSPWVNVASIPLYYHSILDTPDKITIDQVERAYKAHKEIIENIDRMPEGFLFYDNISEASEESPTRASIAIVSDEVCAGDTVKVWNDETRFFSKRSQFHYPALPEWAGTVWDWGDGTDETIGGPFAEHVYTNPGNYTISMTFTDTRHNATTTTKQVTVKGGSTGKDIRKPGQENRSFSNDPIPWRH